MVTYSCLIFLNFNRQFGDWQTHGNAKIETTQSFATVISRKIHENKDTFECACVCVKRARAKRLHALQDASVSVSVFNQLKNCYVTINTLCSVVDVQLSFSVIKKNQLLLHSESTERNTGRSPSGNYFLVDMCSKWRAKTSMYTLFLRASILIIIGPNHAVLLVSALCDLCAWAGVLLPWCTSGDETEYTLAANSQWKATAITRAAAATAAILLYDDVCIVRLVMRKKSFDETVGYYAISRICGQVITRH